MKKLIVWSLILTMGISLAFIAPLFAEYNPDNEQEVPEGMVTTTSIEASADSELIDGMEKIASPEEIPNFRNVIKKGKDLFGLKKASNSISENDSQNANKEQVRERILEKISAPQFINMYENIKQVGNSLWGTKKGSGNDEKKDISERLEELKEMHIQSPSDMSLFKNIRKTVEGKLYGILKDNKDIPENYRNRVERFTQIEVSEKDCVLEAIKEKDVSVQANNLKFAEDLNAAIETRRQCQSEAINLSEENQIEALELCYDEYKAAQEDIRKQSRVSQETFWRTYKENLLECRPDVSTNTPIMIEDGGATIF